MKCKHGCGSDVLGPLLGVAYDECLPCWDRANRSKARRYVAENYLRPSSRAHISEALAASMVARQRGRCSRTAERNAHKYALDAVDLEYVFGTQESFRAATDHAIAFKTLLNMFYEVRA